jgi:hypothetical protein
MKKYVIILNNQIVHRYEAEQQQLFGGPWGSEEAIHIEIDSSLDLNHIKLEDGEVVADQESLSKASQQEINQQAKAFLVECDWKRQRHISQKALNIETSLTEEEYLAMEQQAQQARESIIEE